MKIQWIALAGLYAVSLFGAIPEAWQSKKPLDVVQKADQVALVNQRTAVVFNRKDLSLAAIYHADLPDNRIVPGTPLWSARLRSHEYKDGQYEPQFREFSARSSTQNALFAGKNKDHSIYLRAIWAGNTGIRGGRFRVMLYVTLHPDEDMPRWKFQFLTDKMNFVSLWSVECPRIAFKVDSKKPVRMALPYRTGILASFPRNFAMPYPGPAVKFQMMSLYDENSGAGAYLDCRDDQGFSKCFKIQSDAKRGEALFSVVHFPADRFNTRSFKADYETICGARKGDWFDDAMRYRSWFVTSAYASKGVMQKRSDVPQWLKDAVMSVKISTGKERTVENNLLGMQQVAKLTGGKPVLGIWYEYEQRKDFADGLGRITPAQKGVRECLETLKKENFHILAYVQSQIYDHRNSPEMALAEPFMIRDFYGHFVPYDQGICVCRFTPWWQQRFVELSDAALALGFDGIYMDSFGKSNAECFRADHRHGQGGGNYIVAGQRKMAQTLREHLKKRSNNLVMGGEAPVEAFTDLMDYYLLAVNVMPEGIPLWRAIAGDYMISHGRMMSPGKRDDSIIGETAELFLDGTIPGRLSFYGGHSFLDQPKYAEDKKFVEQVLAALPPTLDYLGFGAMLRPPQLSPAPQNAVFHEYIKGAKVVRPGVLARVCRSHRDNSRCIVLVNIGKTPWQGKVKLAPADGGEEVAMSVIPHSIEWKILK